MHDKRLDKSVKRTKSVSSSNKSLDMVDHIKPSYYMEQLKYHHALKNLDNETTKKFKEHFVRNLASIKFIKTIRVPSIDNVIKSRMQLAKLEDSLERSKFILQETKTVVFDLDETLVHISTKVEGADLQLSIRKLGPKSNGQVFKVSIF